MEAYVCKSCNVYVDLSKHVRCLACGVTFTDQAPVMDTPVTDTPASVPVATPAPQPTTGPLLGLTEYATEVRALPAPGKWLFRINWDNYPETVDACQPDGQVVHRNVTATKWPKPVHRWMCETDEQRRRAAKKP